MSKAFGYRVEAVRDQDRVVDLRLVFPGRTWTLWGRRGVAAEIDLARRAGAGLPVLVGSGLGAALERLLERGAPVAVVDREEPIWAVTGLRGRYAADPRVLWLDTDEPRAVLDALTRWQVQQGGAPFAPVVLPLWLRLDPGFYGEVARDLEASNQADFWNKARQPRFQGGSARVLLFRRPYFLMDEIARALDRLGVDWMALDVGPGPGPREGFVEDLLQAAVGFKPDCALTVNHFGLDREGRLAELLERLGLPLASWFVDNPHLILARYQGLSNPLTAVFTWDEGSVESMRVRGFSHVFHLPLGTDAHLFRPGAGEADPAWTARVSFVGNSMRRAVAGARERAGAVPGLTDVLEAVAEAFAASPESSAGAFLDRDPDRRRLLAALDPEVRLAYESLVTWEATRRYRLDCVRRLEPFAPLIAGDEGWREALGGGSWRFLPPLDYARDLPRFYPASEISFNCTSRQMKGGVNQRAFDVPACGGFVLSEASSQLDRLFEPGTESACYRSPEDIPEVLRRWLDDPEARRRVSQAARRRILAEHTYEHRLTTLLSVLRRTFA